MGNFLFLWLLDPYNLAEKTVIISKTSDANSSSKDLVFWLSITTSISKCLAILIRRSDPNLRSLSLCVKIILSISWLSIRFINLLSPFFLKLRPEPMSLIYRTLSKLLFLA